MRVFALPQARRLAFMPLLLLPSIPYRLSRQLFNFALRHEGLLPVRHAAHRKGMGHHSGRNAEAALPSGCEKRLKIVFSGT